MLFVRSTSIGRPLVGDATGLGKRNNPRPWKAREVRQVLVQVAFFATTAVSSFGGGGAVVNVAFTPLAMLVGLYLFRTSSPQYLSFCMWLWMLTPFVRRVVDFHTAFHSQSLVMLAPFLVSCICCGTAIRIFPQLLNRIYLPYFIMLTVITMGFLLGIVQAGVFSALYAMLNWIVPLLMAIHILAHPELAEANANCLFRTLIHGVLVMGAYGVYQFYYLPIWDAYWAINADMASLGRIEALNIRIFSTMNSPGILAQMLMAGLVSLLIARSSVKLLAAPFGLASFMLSMVRSAWGGWIIAVIFVLAKSSFKAKIRYLALTCMIAAIAVPLLSTGPIADNFQSRFATLANLEDDGSLNARLSFYEDTVASVFTTITGAGLGVTGLASRLSNNSDHETFDNGVLDVVFTFGLLGVPVLVSLLVIVVRVIRSSRCSAYANGSAAIAIAMMTQLIFANVLYGVSGVILHVFAALAIAHRVRAEQAHRKPSKSVIPGWRLADVGRRY